MHPVLRPKFKMPIESPPQAKECAADDSAAAKGQQEEQPQPPPIVVVGNKCEVEGYDGDILKETPEATVVFDWENGYVESSAKERRNINKIFKELLVQARSRYDFGSKLAPKQGSLKSNSGGGSGLPAPAGKQGCNSIDTFNCLSPNWVPN